MDFPSDEDKKTAYSMAIGYAQGRLEQIEAQLKKDMDKFVEKVAEENVVAAEYKSELIKAGLEKKLTYEYLLSEFERQVNTVTFECNIEISEEEKNNYIEHICNEQDCAREDIRDLKIFINEKTDQAEITYEYDGPKFERIRRITGYLVGTVDRWNNAKKAELKDRTISA